MGAAPAIIKSNIIVDNFDGFVLLRSSMETFDVDQIQDCVTTVQAQAAKSESLIFLDLGDAQSFTPAQIESLLQGLGGVKRAYTIELVLVGGAALAAQLQASPLSKVLQVFERKDNGGVRRLATQKVLKANYNSIYEELRSTMIDAIQAGVIRWIGSPPKKMNAASVMVNPAMDVVSVVNMNIDGGEFRLYLCSPQATLRSMVAKILKSEIAESDPAIADGACELLNYLTAFFRQQLSRGDSVVDASPPQLLQPDEIMVLLDQSPQAQRVYTEHGHFDVWFDEAA